MSASRTRGRCRTSGAARRPLAAALLHGALFAAALLHGALRAPAAHAAVDLDGEAIEIVDMHLHPGRFAQMSPGGKAFTVTATPDFSRAYAPPVFARLLDPWAEHVGIQAQAAAGGLDRVVLYAVYAQETTGYFTNEQLAAILLDSRNTRDPQGRPWARGFASIDFFDGWANPGVADQRLAALSSWFAKHRDVFVGVKLAHAHQAVTFDDPEYLAVYEVAASHGVPVLLHTGFSPFPGSQTEPEYYDPQYLETVVSNYDGTGTLPRLEFVLSHVGQGDARSVEHALALAEAHDNVYLEISALNRPITRDASGAPVTVTEPQYPSVLTEIRARGLVPRTLYGSDGPQFSGFTATYAKLMIDGMKTAGYTPAEIRQVMSENFELLFD
ncbi:MAG: amidohydrolase family protein [Polyangiaceae bacterium]|nr:amidohydrolase family protein [Polyangiaceae bacterium]